MMKIIGQIGINGHEYDVVDNVFWGAKACEQCALSQRLCYHACEKAALIYGGDKMYMYLKEKESNEEKVNFETGR